MTEKYLTPPEGTPKGAVFMVDDTYGYSTVNVWCAPDWKYVGDENNTSKSPFNLKADAYCIIGRLYLEPEKWIGDDWCDDMSLAPRDGTVILGWGRVGWDDAHSLPPSNKHAPRVVEMYWNEDVEAWTVPGATPYIEICHATHWRVKLKGPKTS